MEIADKFENIATIIINEVIKDLIGCDYNLTVHHCGPTERRFVA